ncbi:MAG: hypothetical protein GY940_05620, partial [bacterium]|nr:hypothetical protein [bacterium]
ISGTGIKDIVTQVKNNTSAYYELAFSPPPAAAGKKSSIRLKCNRKGVKLTTIAHSEKERPYRTMKNIERKMFVLNVVNGGSWSRMVAPVKMVKFKTTGAKDLKNIAVPLPPDMKNRDLHLYQVDIDPNTRKAVIGFARGKAGQTGKMRIKVNPGKQQFFVIIEPSTASCIYNRVI